ncbi:MAG: hypothetical protein M1818_003526 [Claussenomyces sp. TS43310]|nr:MAG: hypothetical protein M1818_003526 [Claussenomyces sp. TS43310]
MVASLDSERPIMAPSLASKRASQRYSTYSMAPTVSTTASYTVDPEIHSITEGLQKLENRKLASQRFVPSPDKTEMLSKLALGAKLDRALGRRMGGQDAVMRTKTTKKVATEKSEDEKK